MQISNELILRYYITLHCISFIQAHPEPLSILAHAFDEYLASSVCHIERKQDLCQRIESMINSDGLGILAKHIPSLQLVLDVSGPSSDTKELNEAMMASLFGKLLQVLSSPTTPIVFFIDDLQWIDPLSLTLLKALVNGAGPDALNLGSVNEEPASHVMFVGTYRDNEVDDGHLLAKALHLFEADKSINVTKASLSRLSLESLNMMLSDTLCIPVRRVRPLSQLVMSKTDGQPLHVIEHVQALKMDNLLTHSFTRNVWEYDADSIDICPMTDNVAELYAFKLKRLPPDVLRGLQILAVFGSQIDRRVLGFLTNYDGENSVDITAAIDVGLNEGLLEKAANLMIFAHDLIQQTAVELLAGNELVSLLSKLAEAIINNASKAGKLESVLFVAVDLVNRVGSDATPMSSSEQRAMFADLNARAGLKAIDVPDFSAAAKYADHGIAFLCDQCWEMQYDLSLRLYETSVLAHFSSHESNEEKLTSRINAVFSHAKDFSDKFKTNVVWIKLLALSDLSRAIEESLRALQHLGEPLDLVEDSKVFEEMVRIREQFAGDRKKQLLSTAPLTDTNKVKAMKLMAGLIAYFHQQNRLLGAYVVCKMIEITQTHGRCEASVFAAAGFACSLISLLDDRDEGYAWGHATLSLMKKYDTDVLKPSVYAPLYSTCFIWKGEIGS